MPSRHSAHDLARLRQLINDSRNVVATTPRFSTGFASLDRLLPSRGLLREASGSGAGLLALAAAIEAQSSGKSLVLVDRQRQFYPPAAAAWGLDLSQVLVIRPTSAIEEHWAIDQALRCEQISAVIAHPASLDDRVFRRFQLAAETHGTVGLLVRRTPRRQERSWASVRWLVKPQPSSRSWRLRVRLLSCRGRCSANESDVEIDLQEWVERFHATHSRHLASQLARSTAG
jgi:protein ImuA